MKHHRAIYRAALIMISVINRCPADDALRQRFLREAPRGWEELQHLYERVVGTGRSVAVTTDGKRSEELVFDFKLKQNGPWLLWERVNVGNASAVASASNGSYAFGVVKHPDKPWALQGVKQDGSEVYWEARRGGGLAFFQVPWTLVGRFSLPEVTSDPSFKTRALTEDVRDGRSLVVVEFDAAIKNSQPGFPPTELRYGRIVLDPSMSWAMREGKVTLETDSRKWKASIDYDRDKKIKKIELVDEGSGYATKATFEVKQLDFRDVPEDEFKLTAFSLPEPDFMTTPPTPTRWWLWGALTGGGLLVLAAVFDWLRRRAKR